MPLRRALRLLIALVIGLPLLQATLMWVGGLLQSMGDESAAAVVRHLMTAAGIVWIVSLVGLVIVVAIRSLDDSRGDVP